MMRIKSRRCPHCHIVFFPDYRNDKRQKFCNKTLDCKKASKFDSQQRWRAKNINYFKGSAHVQRVQEWRRANPGHGKHKAESTLLQDNCTQKTIINQDVIHKIAAISPPGEPHIPVLQDIWSAKHPVFIGLIAHLTGFVLQDDIDAVALHLKQLGQDVLNRSPQTHGGHSYDP